MVKAIIGTVLIPESGDGMEDKDKIIPHDDMFTVNYSDSMEIRNILRSKLVQAQGHETEKIPLFVSWPGWLEDGIVCLYASDLREILRNAVRETAHAMLGALDNPAEGDAGNRPASEQSSDAAGKRKKESGAFTPLTPAGLTGVTHPAATDKRPPVKQPSAQTESAGHDSGKATQPKHPPKAPAPAASQSQTLGGMLDQDDIEQLIREEMNRKKS